MPLQIAHSHRRTTTTSSIHIKCQCCATTFLASFCDSARPKACMCVCVSLSLEVRVCV